MLERLRGEGRPATSKEQAVLGRWSGWGALPALFDESDESWAALRAQLRSLLTPEEWRSARATTLNAHFTSAEVGTALWRVAHELGFDGGTVLEPGCGSGNLIGLCPVPDRCRFVGVEVDPVSAEVAAALYPSADIRCEGFEEARLPADGFDLTIGNVPFGDIRLHDPVHNLGRHSIHNHFILKSLALVRPGGLVVILTSRYTLDAANPAARREMAAAADFLGAMRLPAGAFSAAAGTKVIEDALIFRCRHPGEPRRDSAAWESVTALRLADGEVDVNEWFVSHPQFVLGTLQATGGMYGNDKLTVVAEDPPLADRLAEALAELVARHPPPARPVVPRPIRVSSASSSRVSGQVSAKEGSILVTETGTLRQVVDGVAVPFTARPRRDTAEVRELARLRDSALRVLTLQVDSPIDSPELDQARSALGDRYDCYAARFGPLNRSRLVAAGEDPETGEALWRRLVPAMGGFRSDPDFCTLLALENFDEDTGVATKAPVFTDRVVAPRRPRERVDTAHEALAVCLDERGEVDLEVVARLLDTSAEEARELLGTLVWEDPADGRLLPADEYLSGDIRTKLAAAIAAGPAFDRHVEALRAVVPEDLGPSEIDGRLGAPWIPREDVEAFARQMFAPPDLAAGRGLGTIRVEYVPLTATWALDVSGPLRHTVAATSEWGTARANGLSLLEASLNQTRAQVWDETDDGRRVRNAQETLLAQEKQDALSERFREWLWEDPARADRLASRYNELFNSVVVPRFDGSHLSVPGLSAEFELRPHQKDGIWRILRSETCLLDHVVGAGKTATMAAAGMEMRRLGLVSKPAYVVPDHMVEQFGREFRRLFPAARLLVAGREDGEKVRRKRLVARIATSDWDAVVLTHSVFGRIPMATETRARYLQELIDKYRETLDGLKAEGARLTVKHIERALKRLEGDHKRLMADERKDDGALFEETGIDYLFVDESHLFKSLRFPTRVDGISVPASQRAEDLMLKLRWLREQQGERVATFATGTSIVNSLAEMFVIDTYLQPHVLERLGIGHFDAFAATFITLVTALELAPDGGSYRMHTRPGRFRNVPELSVLFRRVADVKTKADIDLPTPEIEGGGAAVVVVPPSEELRAYVATLVERAEKIRNRAVRPEQDNMLKVTGDGRKSALDLELVGADADPAGGKIAAVAAEVAATFHRERHRVYADPLTGEPSPRTGPLQVVFCDLGTPKPGGRRSVYDKVRAELVDRGVPREEIRFIHEARSDDDKARLFAECRSGRVAVLLGSTGKMGIGTNIQDRLLELHHLDAPWRPGDIEQRDGRGDRQGNQNAVIGIKRYVTEGSFDVFMWQTLERKARFIEQVKHGRPEVREVDDIGEQALSFAEVKALATGNPLILEKAELETEVARLRRLRRAHERDQLRLAAIHRASDEEATRLAARVKALAATEATRVDTSADRFSARIGDATFAKRADAGQAIQREIATMRRATTPRVVGSLGGFDLTLGRDESGIALALECPARLSLSMGRDEARSLEPVALVRRLERLLQDVDRRLSTTKARLDEAHREAAAASARLGAQFEHASRLAEAEARLLQVDSELAVLAQADDGRVSVDFVGMAPPSDMAVGL